MQPDRVILMIILGAFLALMGIITSQTGLALTILAIIAIAMFFKGWVESLVEKITAGNQSNSVEISYLNESVAAMRADIARIGERLDLLEREKR